MITITAGVGTTRVRPRPPVCDSLLTFCQDELDIDTDTNTDPEGYTVEVSFDETEYFVRRFLPDTFERITTVDPVTGRTVRTNGSNEELSQTEEEASLATVINSRWQVLTLENTGGTTVSTTATIEYITDEDITFEVYEATTGNDYLIGFTLIDSGTETPVAGVATVSVLLATVDYFYLIQVVNSVGQTGWYGQTANP